MVHTRHYYHSGEVEGDAGRMRTYTGQVIHLPSLREQWHIIACNCLIRFAAAMVLDGELALLYVRLTKSCIRQLSSR